VRYEKTQVDASGRNTGSAQPGRGEVRRQQSYDDFFPSLHLRYAIRPNLTARVSVSTAAARPNMSDLYPTTTVSYNATTGLGTVTQNAAGLRPQESLNYDLSIEYYFEPSGVLLGRLFPKGYHRLPRAHLGRDRLRARQRFRWRFRWIHAQHHRQRRQGEDRGVGDQLLPATRFSARALKGLAVFGNYTALETEGEYAAGARALAGFIPRTANAGLTYRWGKLEARLAWRKTSAQLRSYNANIYAQNSFRPYETTDISLKYAFSPRFGVYIDAINIGNNWPQNFTGRTRAG
jgi:TonB-dependent receptor